MQGEKKALEHLALPRFLTDDLATYHSTTRQGRCESQSNPKYLVLGLAQTHLTMTMGRKQAQLLCEQRKADILGNGISIRSQVASNLHPYEQAKSDMRSQGKHDRASSETPLQILGESLETSDNEEHG